MYPDCLFGYGCRELFVHLQHSKCNFCTWPQSLRSRTRDMVEGMHVNQGMGNWCHLNWEGGGTCPQVTSQQTGLIPPTGGGSPSSGGPTSSGTPTPWHLHGGHWLSHLPPCPSPKRQARSVRGCMCTSTQPLHITELNPVICTAKLFSVSFLAFHII